MIPWLFLFSTNHQVFIWSRPHLIVRLYPKELYSRCIRTKQKLLTRKIKLEEKSAKNEDAQKKKKAGGPYEYCAGYWCRIFFTFLAENIFMLILLDRELILNLICVIIDCFDPVIESADNVIMLWSKVYMRYLPFHLQRCHLDLIYGGFHIWKTNKHKRLIFRI